MTVKEFIEQLKLAKNKDAEVVFRVGDETLPIEVMAEVVKDANGIHFPTLGENANAIAIKLKANEPVE
jgi:hypothetical protein